MNTLLSIDTKYTSGRWKGRTVKEVIDVNFNAFQAHWRKRSAQYSKDVKTYFQESELAIRRVRSAAFLFRRDYKRAMSMPNR